MGRFGRGLLGWAVARSLRSATLAFTFLHSRSWRVSSFGPRGQLPCCTSHASVWLDELCVKTEAVGFRYYNWIPHSASAAVNEQTDLPAAHATRICATAHREGTPAHEELAALHGFITHLVPRHLSRHLAQLGRLRLASSMESKILVSNL